MGLLSKDKALKIRSLHSTTKFGVAAKDLKELLKKGCKSLKLPSDGARVCLYDDGTIVTDEYFKTLPDNTVLVLLCRGETWSGVVCDIGRLLNRVGEHGDGLVQAARNLLSGEKSDQRRKILTDLLLTLEDGSDREDREDDQLWFQGVAPRFKRKSDYMRFCCESRIRGYAKELDVVTISKDKARAEFKKASDRLKEMLKEAKLNGCYFDRTAEEPERLCTAAGWFTCQGAFDQDACRSLHSINPYSSRETRIIFSTWNLDHRIEKKRTIIPTLVDALENHRISDVNLDYFYRLLFTRENLKLVHTVCHNKAAHNLECEAVEVFRQQDKMKRTRPSFSNLHKRKIPKCF